MLSLIEKGLSRDDAYKITQNNAMQVWDSDKNFQELLQDDSEVAKHLSSQELADLFDYGYYTRYVDEILERSGALADR